MKKLKTLELYCGTKSFSKVMEAHGHDTCTVDKYPIFEPDFVADLLTLDPHTVAVIGEDVDILWASPPCQGFSVAVIGRNWNHDHTPKTDSARLAMQLAIRTLDLVKSINPKWFFIENPRGKLRRMPFMEELERAGGVKRVTVSYCQYGDTRQKPTDIWTNALWWNPKPKCARGAKCHEAAPRGSKTGTQGIKGATDRGRIPAALFEEILAQMPKDHE